MESLLDYGRSLLVPSGSSKAATSSVFEKTETECTAGFDNDVDDDTASISSSGEDCLDANCFDAFWDTLQVFSLQDSDAHKDDAANNSVESELARPSVQLQGNESAKDEKTKSTPLPIVPSHPFSEKVHGTSPTSTRNEDSAIGTLPPVLSHRDSNILDSEALPEYSVVETLPEYPRQHHDDRGQRDRRQRWKRRGVEAEWLPELQDRCLHNDRGQRDRRHCFLFGRHKVKMGDEALCAEAFRNEALNAEALVYQA